MQGLCEWWSTERPKISWVVVGGYQALPTALLRRYSCRDCRLSRSLLLRRVPNPEIVRPQTGVDRRYEPSYRDRRL